MTYKKIVADKKNEYAVKEYVKKILGKGSHLRYKHFDGRRTVVPIHVNKEIA